MKQQEKGLLTDALNLAASAFLEKVVEIRKAHLINFQHVTAAEEVDCTGAPPLVTAGAMTSRPLFAYFWQCFLKKSTLDPYQQEL